MDHYPHDWPDYDRIISGATDGAPDSIEYTLERQDEIDRTDESGGRGFTIGVLTDVIVGGFVLALTVYCFMVPA